MNRERTKERLLERAIPIGDCLLWVGSKQTSGYGQMMVEGKMYTTHRLSYMVHKGEIPEGLVVMHSCDTPACINPEHLSVGTRAQNNRDAILRGLNFPPSPPPKFEDDLDPSLREELYQHFADKCMVSKIARKYNLSANGLYAMRQRWRDSL